MSHKRFLKFALILLPLLLIGKHKRMRGCATARAKYGAKWAEHWSPGPMSRWHPHWGQAADQETAEPEPDVA